MRIRAGLSLLLLVAVGCAAPNLSRTVGRGNGELHAARGGPFFASLGPPLPVTRLKCKR